MSSTTSSLSISTGYGFGQKIFRGEHFATKDIP
jgi:hypothetical protein